MPTPTDRRSAVPAPPGWDAQMEVVFQAGHPTWIELLARTDGVPGVYAFMVGDACLRIGESAAMGEPGLSKLAHRLQHHLDTGYGRKNPDEYPDYLAFFSTLLDRRVTVRWRRFDGTDAARRALQNQLIKRQPVLWETIVKLGKEGQRGNVRQMVLDFLERASPTPQVPTPRPAPTVGTCDVCAAKVTGRVELCARCRRLVDRIETRKHAVSTTPQRRAALKDAWRAGPQKFVCHYSGVELDDLDHDSRWHLVFDHLTPGDGRRLVACAAVINAMKSDLTEAQFKSVVTQLADVFTGKRTAIERFGPARD